LVLESLASWELFDSLVAFPSSSVSLRVLFEESDSFDEAVSLRVSVEFEAEDPLEAVEFDDPLLEELAY